MTQPLKTMTLRNLSLIIMWFVTANVLADDSLESRLKEMDAATLAAQARQRGNPKAGALIFFKSAAACVKCHTSGKDASPLGPDLATIGKEATDEHIIESILDPSKTIRKGFETITVDTLDGKSFSGLIASDTDTHLLLRDASNLEKEIKIAKTDIDEVSSNKQSMMPQGLVAALRSEKEFYDLTRYVMEIAKGGPKRARKLRPREKDLLVIDDSKNLDHAGIIGSLGEADLEAGKKMFLGHCANCHGVDGNTPKLPTARAFGNQSLKYGADPYKMFMTLTRGAGLMAPMQHLSPKERYQVVHYIREALMKDRNDQYAVVDGDYLKDLPKGTLKGEFAVTSDRDYGPVLGSQIGSNVNNALSFRLPDDVTVCYDLHRMRLVGAWSGGFLDLAQTQHYRQRGERMPQIDGDLLPGLSDWQWAFDDSFEINDESKPPRGPVRDDWLQYYGHYLHGDQAVLSYGIHGRKILETIQTQDKGDQLTLHHTLRIDAGDQPLKLSVARFDKPDGPAGVVSYERTVLSGGEQAASDHFAITTGKPDAKTSKPKMANRPRHVVDGEKANELDLGTPKRTIVVRFRTTGNGTLIASAPADGEWKPNGKTLFIRGNRLVFDIGWVGAIVGKTNVADGDWHSAALVVDEDETRLFVDGKQEGKRDGFRRDADETHVLKIGSTATDFGGDYAGDIDWIRIFDAVLSKKQLEEIANEEVPPSRDSLFAWKPKDGDSLPDVTPEPKVDRVFAAAAVAGETDGLTWSVESGRIVLSIPASDKPRVFSVIRASGPEMRLDQLSAELQSAASNRIADPTELTRGGPERWSHILTTEGEIGEPINGYALDTLTVPFENPWNAWMRTSALDFFDDGRAVVTTHGGDVYIVSGIDDKLSQVKWKRFVAGLFEPFGVRVVDGTIYVTCRDGLKRLHDYDDNGEADFVEAFWIDDDVSSMFHAYNFDLQTDSAGNFYFAKAGQYTNHHRPGTIMRVPPEGGSAYVVAWGIRTPNGMGKLADDRFTVSDNQGPWMPAGKVSLIETGSFLGNMPINKEQDAWLKERHGGELPKKFDEPMIWTPQELDNSCGGQVWVDDPRFGPLTGRLFHSSFGKGWLYYMSMQEVDKKTQASIVALPHQWDAGVMRLRVNPRDGQLYGTGLSGWQGPGNGRDGCFQRLRYTGDSVRFIDSVQVTATGLELKFNFAVDQKSIGDPESWEGEMWDYLWSRNYGSDQYSVLKPGEKGRDKLPVTKVEMIGEKKVRLTIPDLKVCDQVSLKMNFNGADGKKFVEHVYLTVHAKPE